MKKAKPPEALWKRIAPELKELEAGELRAIVRDLFKLAPENRAFLATWLGDEDALGELFEVYRTKITEQFTEDALEGNMPDIAACRKAIKEYQRVTASPLRDGGFDVRGTMELGLLFVEECAACVGDLGWYEEHAFESMGGVLRDLGKLIEKNEGWRWSKVFLARVKRLHKRARSLDGGFEDDVEELLRVVRRRWAEGGVEKTGLMTRGRGDRQ